MFTLIKALVFTAILALFYRSAGFWVGLPLCFFAGAFLAIIYDGQERLFKKRRWWGGYVFAAFFMALLFPPLCIFLSDLLTRLGWQTAGEFVFRERTMGLILLGSVAAAILLSHAFDQLFQKKNG